MFQGEGAVHDNRVGIRYSLCVPIRLLHEACSLKQEEE